MRTATPWSIYVFVAMVGVTLGAVFQLALPSRAPAESPAICPAEPDDAWVQRRLSYFETACGPVPFEVKIWKKGGEEGLEGTCGRPEKIRPFVPKLKTSSSGEPTQG